jgi:TPR repeat protein
MYCLEHNTIVNLDNNNQQLWLGFFKTNDDNAAVHDDDTRKESEGETKEDDPTEGDQQHRQHDPPINSVMNCPICLETLPKDDRNFVRFTCCGQGVHKTCANACPPSTKNQCPLCRAHAVANGSEEDIQRLLHWVERGKPWAQIILAARYFDGNGVGIPQSYAKAAELLMQAATVGADPDAQFNLALMYENGHGVEQSYACAADWYEMAIVSGNGIYPRAWFNIGVLYDCGDGVDQSFEKSRECFSVAAAQGHTDAIEFIDAIEEEEKEERQRKLAQQVNEKIQTVLSDDVEASTWTPCSSTNTKKRKR